MQRNEVSRAKNFYKKALTIDPGDAVSRANLQAIAKQEATNSADVETSNSVALQDALPSREIQNLLNNAQQKMQQINSDISANKRNYKVYQEAQAAYQDVFKNSARKTGKLNKAYFL